MPRLCSDSALTKQMKVPRLLALPFQDQLRDPNGCDIPDMTALFEASQPNTVRERRGDRQHRGGDTMAVDAVDAVDAAKSDEQIAQLFA